MPLKLSDAELDQLYAAARPIDVGLPSRTNVCTRWKRTPAPKEEVRVDPERTWRKCSEAS